MGQITKGQKSSLYDSYNFDNIVENLNILNKSNNAILLRGEGRNIE
jgi:hypothetical protein